MGDYKRLWPLVKVLPTDYTDYGGEVVRWGQATDIHPDCSCGCRHACYLEGSGDWLVCASPTSPRAGLLTWEHQAGAGCFEAAPDDDERDDPAARRG